VKITLQALRDECWRVFGADSLSARDDKGHFGPAFVIHVRGGRLMRFEAPTRMAARRFALASLQRMAKQ
jgi:hypothetical protein